MTDSQPVSQRNGIVPVMAPQISDLPSQPNSRPAINDSNSNNHYVDVAQKHWLKSSKLGNVKPNVIKQDIWDHLEEDGFAHGSLLVLENLQILER
jgi:intron-binding protein aquarius